MKPLADRNLCHSGDSTSYLNPTQQQAPIWLYIKQQTNKQEKWERLIVLSGYKNCIIAL